MAKLNDNFTLMPFASIGYMNNNHKAYKETGENNYSASIKSASNSFINKKIGMKVLLPMKMLKSTEITPYVNASVSHASKLKTNKDTRIDIQYQGESYNEKMNDKSSSNVSYDMGAGVLVKRDNIELQALYNCTLKAKYSNHQGSLKLRINL